ncbi:DUF6221 family protein [Streptomyces sp. H27-C3]|uniref:DUF6221 family protein n=1 Tax=Streptomyces sp. H27-C3 TaxID=3046305 RepID=UPI0024BA648F|nr:DUF6221 family protein [Streptomyces sp. H27-C3]MDJ0460600.1 DUF6221 family protein [Streptomyces sp. H27-C3]
MSDDLVQFLRDRYDEDERVARAATPGPWVWTPEQDVWGQCGPTLIRVGTDAPGSELMEVLAGQGHDAWGLHVSEGDQAHIARHDPARVLAEIEAKREVVRLTVRARDYAPTFTSGFGAAMEQALRLFAVVYADHPGYLADWRP